MEMSELRQFIERQDIRSDAFWRSVLQSDSRNLFPKHELAKIELAKNKVAKLRLAIENLPAFLSLQAYARNLEAVAKTTPERQIKKELEEIQGELSACRAGHLSSDYDFQILETKGRAEQLCAELAKPRMDPEVKELLQRSPKWKAYLENHCRTPQEYECTLNERDKANLAFNLPLRHVDDSLLSGTTAKIVEERVREEVVKHRLRQVFASESLEVSFSAEGDPFSRQWEQVEAQLGQESEQEQEEGSNYV